MKKPNLEKVKKTLKRTNFPLLVIVETVAGCNLNCIMCPQKTMKRSKGVMDMKLYEKICKEIAKRGSKTQLWMTIMGELFTIGDKAINYIITARKLGVPKIMINTNGVLLNKKLIDKLLKAQPDKIFFGIDAATKETYDKIRIGGNFKRLRKNIIYIIKRKRELALDKPEIYVQFIVMNENEHEEKMFKNYWIKEGAIVKIRQRLGWGTGVEVKNLNLPQSARNMPCPWLVRTISVHWSGKVAQCDADYEGNYYAGDLNHQTIEEVWQGELKKRRDRHWAGDFSFPTCQKCNDWQCGLSEYYYPKNKNE